MGLAQLVPDEVSESNVEQLNTDQTEQDQAVKNDDRNRGTAALEWVLICVGSVLIALFLRTFLVQSFYIPSASMEATLTVNDRVLVNKLSYQFSSPSAGDVIVFGRPQSLGGNMDNLIKRVIATEGDIVEGRDGAVFVNGVKLEERYLTQGTLTSAFAPVEIQPGQLWVMGDSRNNSADSRVFGPIDVDTVVGRSVVQIWPISDIELL